MITGVLNTNSNAGIYITDEKRSKSVNVKPGQYLYLAVNDCWIPVVIRYSPRSHGWVFQNLENIDIDGQKVQMSSPDCRTEAVSYKMSWNVNNF